MFSYEAPLEGLCDVGVPLKGMIQISMCQPPTLKTRSFRLGWKNQGNQWHYKSFQGPQKKNSQNIYHQEMWWSCITITWLQGCWLGQRFLRPNPSWWKSQNVLQKISCLQGRVTLYTPCWIFQVLNVSSGLSTEMGWHPEVQTKDIAAVLNLCKYFRLHHLKEVLVIYSEPDSSIYILHSV